MGQTSSVAQLRYEIKQLEGQLSNLSESSSSLAEMNKKLNRIVDSLQAKLAESEARNGELVAKIKLAIADIEYELHHDDDESQALATLAEALLIHQRSGDVRD